MKKHVFGRQFKRDANERKALFKNLLTSLVLEERIVTTEAKAKAIKAAADKLVTKAKKGESAYDRLAPDVRYAAVEKLIKTIAPRFADRNGGYTRIVKLGRRVADNAPQVVMEWVDRASANEEQITKNKGQKGVTKNKSEKVQATGEAKKPARVAKAEPAKEEKTKKVSALKKLVTRQKKG